MNIYTATKRAISRTSLVRAIPLIAFILGLSLAVAFTGLHYAMARSAHFDLVRAEGTRIAELVSDDVASGDFENVEARLADLAPQRAEIKLADGRPVVSPPGTDWKRHAVRRAIVSDGQVIGSLTYAAAKPYAFHFSILSVISLILFVAGFAALVLWMIAKEMSKYLEQVSQFVALFSLESKSQIKRPMLNFAEFRKLNAVAQRTTRRLAKEVDMLRKRAEIDDRTGLYNQFYLKARIDHCLDEAEFDQPAALLLINIEGLNELATELGGSRYVDLLSHIGSELADCTRQAAIEAGQSEDSWVLACLPSDQFAMLATGFASRDDIAPLVRRIHGRFREFSTNEGLATTLKASGSIVMLPEDGDTNAVILQRAETTLQSLRAENSGGFRFYTPKLERQSESRARLEAELRKAVEEDRFVPLFQPKIDLTSGTICGVEALARWRLDSGRLVSPAVFVSLAEELGLIDKIGKQIMHKACAAAAGWAREGHRLNLAVNVSPLQFESDDLANMTLEAIARSGLSPRQLELEITESLAIEKPERVRSVLTPLRKMGIRLAVDDFGTGHSNLAILTQLEFDVFKIDRQFVSGLPNDTQAAAIIDLMMGMANTLEMQIVAEGIETEAQARFMAQQGCHIGQGFLFSMPVTDEAIQKLLKDQSVLHERRSA